MALWTQQCNRNMRWNNVWYLQGIATCKIVGSCLATNFWTWITEWVHGSYNGCGSGLLGVTSNKSHFPDRTAFTLWDVIIDSTMIPNYPRVFICCGILHLLARFCIQLGSVCVYSIIFTDVALYHLQWLQNTTPTIVDLYPCDFSTVHRMVSLWGCPSLLILHPCIHVFHLCQMLQ